MVTPVILSLKCKAPFDEVHEKSEHESKYKNLIFYDNEYYSKYIRNNLKNAKVIKISDYSGDCNNPPKIENVSDLEAVEYYVDVLVYADVQSTKEQVFEMLVMDMNTKMTNDIVVCEAICKVGKSRYASLALNSFISQQYYEDTLRYNVIYKIETAMEPNLINDSLEVTRTKVLDLLHSKKAKYVTIYEYEIGSEFDQYFDAAEHITYLGFNFQHGHPINNLPPDEVYKKCVEQLTNKDTLLFSQYKNGNNTHIDFINDKS